MTGEFFHTADVDIAAFLRCRGIRYLHLEPNPSNAALTDFVFSESTLLFDCLREWADAEEPCHVDAREFGTVRRHFFRAAQKFARRAAAT